MDYGTDAAGRFAMSSDEERSRADAVPDEPGPIPSELADDAAMELAARDDGPEGWAVGEGTANQAATTRGEDTMTEQEMDRAMAEAAQEEIAELVAVDASAGPGTKPTEGFLDELARAMKAVGAQERDRLEARAVEAAAAVVQRTQERAAGEADALRDRADRDVESIHAWTAEQIAAVQAEAESRIDQRRERLDAALTRHASITEAETAAVDAEVARYRDELDTYFADVERRSDPTDIARLASAVPASPDLDRARADARSRAMLVLAQQEMGTGAGEPVLAAELAVATTVEGVATAMAGDGGVGDEPGDGDLPNAGDGSSAASGEALAEAPGEAIGVMDPDAVAAEGTSLEGAIAEVEASVEAALPDAEPAEPAAQVAGEAIGDQSSAEAPVEVAVGAALAEDAAVEAGAVAAEGRTAASGAELTLVQANDEVEPSESPKPVFRLFRGFGRSHEGNGTSH